MKPCKAIDLLKLCDHADRGWSKAATAWEKHQNSDMLEGMRKAPERVMRDLSPAITCDYPGLYPTFKVGGKDAYSLSGAFADTLKEKDRKVFLAWRALRGTVKRGMTISMIHAGDRGKCRFVTTVKRDDGKPAIVDLTWYLGNAFGERYSDRTRLLSVQDAASLVAWLARELFGTESALKADWL